MIAIPVALVEDDAAVRQLLREWVDVSKGFRCISASESAESAESLLLDNKPAIVLADINLPGMNGIEFVRKMKPQLPDTQFVILTVHEDTDHIFNALAAGATGYLLKGINRKELVDALKLVNSGGSPMTSFIARRVVQSFQRTAPAKPMLPGLARREREVLEYLSQGYYYKEIAAALDISIETVGTYARRIYTKLHVTSRGQAVAKYTQFKAQSGIDQ